MVPVVSVSQKPAGPTDEATVASTSSTMMRAATPNPAVSIAARSSSRRRIAPRKPRIRSISDMRV